MFFKTAKQSEAVTLMGNDTCKRILLYGGSRSGKTFIIIRQIILRAIKCPNSRHLIVRLVFNDINRSIWQGTLPEVFKICFPELKVTFNKSLYFVQLPNGSQIWVGGLDDKERAEKILGNEYSSIYFNEAHQMAYKSILIAYTRLAERNSLVKKVFYDCNPPTTKSWMFLLFFLHIDPITKADLPLKEMYAVMQLNPYDNAVNISEDYITTTLETLPERHRKRFLLGEFQNDVDGALWNQEMINKFRVMEMPKMRRIALGLDPATTTNKNSDETGIVIAGKGFDNHYYVWNDSTGIYTPNEWGKIVVNYVHTQRIDIVVAESNQGGQMVESNIKNLDQTVKVKLIHAKNSKSVRAEPIVGLYESGMVHHVGVIDSLETEMTEWDAKNSKFSPGRIDSLVHALAELSEAKTYAPAKFNF